MPTPNGLETTLLSRICMKCGQVTVERVCPNPDHVEREPTQILGLPDIPANAGTY